MIVDRNTSRAHFASLKRDGYNPGVSGFVKNARNFGLPVASGAASVRLIQSQPFFSSSLI